MRYDEIRAEGGRGGGGEKRRDELLMAQQVWPPLGNTWATRGGAIPTLCKGQREGESLCLYLYLCVCLCVCGLCPPVLPTVPPTTTIPPPPPPLIAAVNVTAANRRRRRPNESPALSPHVSQLGQSNGKASCVTTRCIVEQIILLTCGWASWLRRRRNLGPVWCRSFWRADTGGAAGFTSSRRTTPNRYVVMFTVMCVCVCVLV